MVNCARINLEASMDPYLEARCPTLSAKPDAGVRTEPCPDFFVNPNQHICFHTLVAQCKESQLELPLVAQFDDGATPSMISLEVAKTIGATIRTRGRPVTITGVG